MTTGTTDPQAPDAGTAVADDRVLLLMDGHSLAYRAFFALPPENFSTTTGQTTNAVYGFTSMLINLLRDEQPTHVAVAFDLSRQTWRREEYVEYKANRSASPSEFGGQVDLIKDVLTAMRIPYLTAENFEADDIIATLTTRAVAEGLNVRICTGDRDALQLVSDQVTLLYLQRGVSEMARYTPEAVEAKYGLTPLQYPDFAALRGDPSDNLPGIPGVGEKTATKWIREFGSLTALVDRVDEVRGKAGDALREALPHVLVNRRLTELSREVPIDADPATDLARLPYDREAVHHIFDDLQFRVLRERLLEYFEQADETSTEGFEVAGARLAPGTVRQWLAEHGAGRVGLVVRGTWAPGGGDVHTLAFAAADGAAAVVDVGGAPTRTTRPRWPPGSPIRRPERSATISSPRSMRSPRGAGRWTASPATPRLPRIWRCPDSRPSTLATWCSGTCTAPSIPSTAPTQASSLRSSRSSARPARPSRTPGTWSGPGPSSTWPTPWSSTWTRWVRSRCWPTSSSR
jgi:DNA polymerase-1